MENDIDAFDEEVEDLEAKEKEEVEEAETKKAKPVTKVAEPEAPTEKYIAVHQPEIIGIMDTVSKELIIQGLPSMVQAELEAIKLNKLEKIENSTGVNN